MTEDKQFLDALVLTEMTRQHPGFQKQPEVPDEVFNQWSQEAEERVRESGEYCQHFEQLPPVMLCVFDLRAKLRHYKKKSTAPQPSDPAAVKQEPSQKHSEIPFMADLHCSDSPMLFTGAVCFNSLR